MLILRLLRRSPGLFLCFPVTTAFIGSSVAALRRCSRSLAPPAAGSATRTTTATCSLSPKCIRQRRDGLPRPDTGLSTSSIGRSATSSIRSRAKIVSSIRSRWPAACSASCSASSNPMTATVTSPVTQDVTVSATGNATLSTDVGYFTANGQSTIAVSGDQSVRRSRRP